MVQIENRVWLGMEDGRITVLDCNSLQTVGSWHADKKTIGSFCSYQNCVWSGSDNGEISMWYASPDPLDEFFFLSASTAHFNNINCIQKVFKTIWTASSDHAIIIWDAEVR